MIRSKHQKGSMMIEVVAVVALLALLTPLLFRQIQRRTDEVDNVRIASIMREAKDIVQRAIEDNVDNMHHAGFSNSEKDDCKAWLSESYVHGKLADYAPSGIFPTGISVVVCQHLVNGNSDRPMYYGVIVDTADDLPFLAAADIATMIGAEGGVCTDGEHDVATGVRQGWKVDNFGSFSCSTNQVVAITSLVGASGFGGITAITANDYIAPDGTIQGVTGYVGDDLYVENTLAVGQNCVTSAYDPDVDRNPACQPAFEVSYYKEDGTKLDNPEVRLGPNTKLIFKNADGTNYAAPTGDKIAIPTREHSIATHGAAKGPDSGYETDKDVEYTVNAKGESVMKNIRLLDRGNALLTDLLPNYVLKGVLASDKNCTGDCQINNVWTSFECPPYHKQAVIIEGCADNAEFNGETVKCKKAEGRAYQYCVYNGN